MKLEKARLTNILIQIFIWIYNLILVLLFVNKNNEFRIFLIVVPAILLSINMLRLIRVLFVYKRQK